MFLAAMIDEAAGGIDQRRPNTRKIREDKFFDPTEFWITRARYQTMSSESERVASILLLEELDRDLISGRILALECHRKLRRVEFA